MGKPWLIQSIVSRSYLSSQVLPSSFSPIGWFNRSQIPHQRCSFVIPPSRRVGPVSFVSFYDPIKLAVHRVPVGENGPVKKTSCRLPFFDLLILDVTQRDESMCPCCSATPTSICSFGLLFLLFFYLIDPVSRLHAAVIFDDAGMAVLLLTKKW